MRSSKSRSRNKNRNNRPSGGNIVNRVFDSSGPEGKVRGTPQQIIDKYNQLARDAQLAGDRVAVENFQQHAEHYTRMLAAAQKEIEARQQQNQQNHQGGQNGQPSGGSGGGNDGQQGNSRRGNQRRDDRSSGGNEVAGQGEQPDVIETGSESGLVETPEAQSEAAPVKAKKPAEPVVSDDGGSEAKPEKPKRTRTRRKAPKSEEAAGEPAAPTDAAPAEPAEAPVPDA